MATGAGRTFTAVTECYRLLKYGGFRRVLFLVDRNNLDQTLREFQNYGTPDDAADSLSSTTRTSSPAPAWWASHVVISTIQRVYAALRGQQVADADVRRARPA